MKILVYGTLKQDEDNYHRYLKDKEPEFKGEVKIPYKMYSNGLYPMLVRDNKPNSILVNIFDIDKKTAKLLDSLETPFGYIRENLELDEVGETYMYIYPEKVPENFELVKDGNFIRTDTEFEWDSYEP